MLLLFLNIHPNRVDAGFAHTESTVTGLPREALELRPSLVNPSRRIGLDQASDVRHGMRRGHSNQEVNVIRDSVDAECDAANFADDAAKVSVQVGLHLR